MESTLERYLRSTRILTPISPEESALFQKMIAPCLDFLSRSHKISPKIQLICSNKYESGCITINDEDHIFIDASLCTFMFQCDVAFMLNDKASALGFLHVLLANMFARNSRPRISEFFGSRCEEEHLNDAIGKYRERYKAGFMVAIYAYMLSHEVSHYILERDVNLPSTADVEKAVIRAAKQGWRDRTRREKQSRGRNPYLIEAYQTSSKNLHRTRISAYKKWLSEIDRDEHLVRELACDDLARTMTISTLERTAPIRDVLRYIYRIHLHFGFFAQAVTLVGGMIEGELAKTVRRNFMANQIRLNIAGTDLEAVGRLRYGVFDVQQHLTNELESHLPIFELGALRETTSNLRLGELSAFLEAKQD